MSSRIFLCWFPNAARSQIRAVRTLDQMLEQANAREGDACANLVRLNWMVHHIKNNGLAKPVVVDANWQTIVGDTRLMALDLLGWKHLPVLAQLPDPQGHVITNLYELNQCCKINGIVVNGDKDFFHESVDWVEFDVDSSHDHMHDEVERQCTIDFYLQHQPKSFEFDIGWCQSKIDWETWSTRAGKASLSLAKN